MGRASKRGKAPRVKKRKPNHMAFHPVPLAIDPAPQIIPETAEEKMIRFKKKHLLPTLIKRGLYGG